VITFKDPADYLAQLRDAYTTIECNKIERCGRDEPLLSGIDQCGRSTISLPSF
jgi:hypothetical protein